MGAGDKPATLMFDSAGHASGFAGCNRAAGSYTIDGPTLHFNPMAMTRMACTQGMELEQAYAALLGTVRGYRFTNDTLELLSGDTVLARFVR
jgi:heat shock protein HslJ